MADLEVTVEHEVLRLRLNRPEVLNALDRAMVTGLAEHLEAARARDDVRVVLLEGAGPAFCAGADIGGADAVERIDDDALQAANRVIRAVVSLDKPVVAAVRGVAAGVGCSIAVAADLVVAAESASFLLVFSRVGLMPDGGTTATVAASVGRARAMRMALLAEPMSGREAYTAGLVSHLAPDADFPALVDQVIRRVAAGPPLAHAATKKAVNAAALGSLETALETERRGQGALLRTADAAEGVRAFVERRRPEFDGA